MDLSTVPNIVAALFSLFVYVSDTEQYGVEDDKRSHAETVVMGGKFYDDCDGFAFTAVDLLRKIKVPAWTVVVQSRFELDNVYHMIAVYQDPVTKEVMTLDNRYPGPRTLSTTLKGSGYKIFVSKD